MDIKLPCPPRFCHANGQTQHCVCVLVGGGEFDGDKRHYSKQVYSHIMGNFCYLYSMTCQIHPLFESTFRPLKRSYLGPIEFFLWGFGP